MYKRQDLIQTKVAFLYTSVDCNIEKVLEAAKSELGTAPIIGKPNVGKSTFFNYLAGSRISIVQDTPGVTRDRIYADTKDVYKRQVEI